MRRKLQQLEKNPGEFNIVGGNCSSHACEVLNAGGILPEGIPGFDTPQGLEDALVASYRAKCFNGYTTLSTGGRVTVTYARGAPPFPCSRGSMR